MNEGVEMNQNKPDHDKIGFCALCHSAVGEWIDVSGHTILKWLPIRRECLFKLSNNSILHASLCSNCDDRINAEHFSDLMNSIIRGWEKELEVSTMPAESKADYINRYYQLKIMEKI